MKILAIKQLFCSIRSADPNDKDAKYLEPFTFEYISCLPTENKTQIDYIHVGIVEVNGIVAYFYGDENLENTLT